MIAAAFCMKYQKAHSAQLHVISAVAGITFSLIFPKIHDVCTRFPSSLAIFSILLHCYQAGNLLGVVGACMYAVSGTLIGASGYIVGIRRVDVFHYCLVIGNTAFFKAL